MQKIMFKQCGKYCNIKRPEDFVICTGKQYSIKQVYKFVAKYLKMQIRWKGKGIR